jgi:mono/diheme cytochrome c family protein
MPSWGTSLLSDTELATVRAFLAPGCSGTPAALFASNCATCHGATGSGGSNANGLAGPNIRCKTSAAVLDAVVDGFGGMPALPDLTSGQTSAIVSYIRTGCP